MVDITKILEAGRAAQAASLLSYNYSLSKKPTTKKIINAGITNIAGISLLKAQKEII